MWILPHYEQLRPQQSFEGDTIFISEVNSPSQFWFQPGDSTATLNQLHRDMKTLYGSLEVDYTLAFGSFAPGLLVACNVEPALPGWYRALVTETFGDTSEVVRLFFLDYGTVCNVYKKNCKILAQRFLQIPQLSYRGRLGILPPGQQNFWTLQETIDFIHFIKDKKLIAKVVYYSAIDCSYVLDVYEKRKNGSGRGRTTITNIRRSLAGLAGAGEFSAANVHQSNPNFFFPSFENLEKSFSTLADEVEFQNITGGNYKAILMDNWLALRE